LAGKRVLVVGGDNVAASRAVFAVEAGAAVTVVAPFNTLSPALKQVLSNGSIQWIDRTFDSADLNNASLVFVCNDSSVSASLSRQIGVLCREKKVPVNVASAADLSDFYFMSTYKDQSLQVAISTNGNGPRLASKLRKQIVNSIPTHAGAALESLAKLRQLLKQADPSAASNQRRLNFVNRVSETWAVETLAALTDA
ncbi:siroheme synthase Met8, partial [Obelidium mucronatum]